MTFKSKSKKAGNKVASFAVRAVSVPMSNVGFAMMKAGIELEGAVRSKTDGIPADKIMADRKNSVIANYNALAGFGPSLIAKIASFGKSGTSDVKDAHGNPVPPASLAGQTLS